MRETWNFGRQLAPTGMPRRQPDLTGEFRSIARKWLGTDRINLSKSRWTNPIRMPRLSANHFESEFTRTNQNRGNRGDSESDFVELGVFAHFCQGIRAESRTQNGRAVVHARREESKRDRDILRVR